MSLNKGTISIGNTSEPTFDFLQGHSFVFLEVTPVSFEKEDVWKTLLAEGA